MKSLKINFDGPNNVSIDWNGEVEDLGSVAQKAGVAVMTQRGSDKFLPNRGTDVTRTLLSYGVFDLLGMQHTLNFGTLKARQDIQDFESPGRDDVDLIASIRMVLIQVKDNAAHVSVTVKNQAEQTTREITQIS